MRIEVTLECPECEHEWKVIPGGQDEEDGVCEKCGEIGKDTGERDRIMPWEVGT